MGFLVKLPKSFNLWETSQHEWSWGNVCEWPFTIDSIDSLDRFSRTLSYTFPYIHIQNTLIYSFY